MSKQRREKLVGGKGQKKARFNLSSRKFTVFLDPLSFWTTVTSREDHSVREAAIRALGQRKAMLSLSNLHPSGIAPEIGKIHAQHPDWTPEQVLDHLIDGVIGFGSQRTIKELRIESS